MPRNVCPGQDMRFWKPDDIYREPCAHCGEPVEFFKDDLRRKCPHCGKFTVNPKNDLSCAKWCRFGAECLGQLGRLPSDDDKDGSDDT